MPRKVTFNLTEQVFPTEAAIRAKETRKAKEAVGKAEGKTLKEMRKRKPQQQEEHFDDCGSDTGPIEEKASWLALSLLRRFGRSECSLLLRLGTRTSRMGPGS